MKKLFTTSCLLALFTFGCETCPHVPGFFDIQDVRLENQNSRIGYSEPLGYTYPDSVQFEHFFLKVDYHVNYYGKAASTDFSLVPAAYALSCREPGESGTKEKLESLELVALTDFNENFKAGASLNPVIKFNGLPVAEYIARQNQQGLYQSAFTIELTQKPDPAIKQTFKLIFTL